MIQNIYFSALLICIYSVVASLVAFPFALRFGKMIGLIDKPNYRKVHRKPVPVVGGLGLGLTLLVAGFFSELFQSFIFKHGALFISLFSMLLIGIFDDKFSLSVKIRVVIELLCAFLVANSGIRLHSLHGIFGIYEFPILIQYAITMFFILAITNAFNLMDGIDGLVGGISVINAITMLFALLIIGQNDWGTFFIPLIIGLIIFLTYNWNPAKIFMGDAGSLMLGFLFASTGIYLLDKSFSYAPNFQNISNCLFAVVSSCLMIPAMDTIRVFYQRAKQGKSPFSADRTHLHHLFLQLNLSHAKAAKKIIVLHISIIAISLLIVNVIGILPVILLQACIAVFYTAFLKFVRHYFHWFRFIKKYELE